MILIRGGAGGGGGGIHFRCFRGKTKKWVKKGLARKAVILHI